MKPLRVLVVDKVAVLTSNRLRWRRLAEEADVVLTLLAPTHWVENCVDEPFQPLSDEPYATVLGRPSLPGRELRSIYLSGIIQALRQSRPDVIVMMEESFSLFALQTVLLARIFAPTARVVFYSLNIVSYRTFPYRLSWFYRWVSNVVMRRSAVALCLNDRAVEVLRTTSTFSGEIRQLFFGINDEIFQPTDPAIARAEIGLPMDLDVILYAGRLLEQKGVQDLIEAFVALRRRPGRPVKLMIVGDGPYADALRQQAAATGLTEAEIEFRPAVSIRTMPMLMASANVFVLPSRTEWCEQFGRVNAEAMLVGTTIVGSTSGEIPQVIGDGGYIFSAGDVGSLLQTLEQALDQPLESDRRRTIGRAIAMRRFSTRGFVEGIIDLLESLGGRPLRHRRTMEAEV